MCGTSFALGYRRDRDAGREDELGPLVPYTIPLHEGILRRMRERPCSLPPDVDAFEIEIANGLLMTSPIVIGPASRADELVQMAIEGWNLADKIRQKIDASAVLKHIGPVFREEFGSRVDVDRHIDVIPTDNRHPGHAQFALLEPVEFLTVVPDRRNNRLLVRGYPTYFPMHEWANAYLLERLREAALNHLGFVQTHQPVAIA